MTQRTLTHAEHAHFVVDGKRVFPDGAKASLTEYKNHQAKNAYILPSYPLDKIAFTGP